MPELGLYLSWKDIVEFVEFALREGAALVPHLHYDRPQYVTLENGTSFDEFRSKTSLFFIVKSSYLVSPLEIDSFVKKEKKLFFIVQRSGGPTIDFSFRTEFRESGRLFIGPSSLGHHPTYWNTTTCRNEKPPDSLVTFYKSLVKEIKKGAKRIRPGVSAYWVGRHAQELVRQGAKLVGFEKKKIDL